MANMIMRCIFLALVFCGITARAQLNFTCFSNDAGILEAVPNPEKLVFNQAITSQPSAIAYCHTEQQVINALSCAKQSGIKAVARGGGHGYQGYAAPTGTIVIDITNLTSFTVDNAANTATFGPGLRLGQLYLKMYLEANSLFPAGTCPWVGTPGHLLGGGTGLNVRKYGMACDQLVSLNMVDYQGNVLVASNTSNTDLLWASCGGGGGNLGIVTSFTVKLNSLDAVPAVTVARMSWGYEHAVDVFDKVQKWAPTADRRLGVQVLIGFGGANVNIQYEGVQADCQAAIAASGLLDVPGITLNDVVQESWINATLLWASESMGISDTTIYALNMTDGLPAGQDKSFQAASSYNQQLMSREGIQGMVDAVTSLGTGDGTSGGYIEHKMLGGAVADPAPTSTAFHWRQAIFETQYFYYWQYGDNGPANSWLSSVTQAMKPYVGQGNYINYPDPLLAATTAWPTAYYGGNLQAYIDVKTKYDPTNYFSNPLTVAPYTNSSSLTPATSKTVASAMPVVVQPSLPASAATTVPAGLAPAEIISVLPDLTPAVAPTPAKANPLPTAVASAG